MLKRCVRFPHVHIQRGRQTERQTPARTYCTAFHICQIWCDGYTIVCWARSKFPWIQSTSLHALSRLSVMFLLLLPFYFRTFIAFLFAKVSAIHLCRQLVLTHTHTHSLFLVLTHTRSSYRCFRLRLATRHTRTHIYRLSDMPSFGSTQYRLKVNTEENIVREWWDIKSLHPVDFFYTAYCEYMPFESKTPSDLH